MKFCIRNKTPVIVSYSICSFFKRIFGFNVGGVALFPFIIVRDIKVLNTQDYITHESIHIRQYIETGIVGLLIIGWIQYVYALVILKKTRMQAYYFMSHEQEAHQNDTNPDYLKTRKWFSFYKYLLKKNKKEMDYINGKRIIY